MQVSKYEPPFGQAALDNKDVPLARLVLVPCRNEDGTLVDEETAPATFALIFFLAHIAGTLNTINSPIRPCCFPCCLPALGIL